jgi:hypothetical protein
MSAAHEHVIEAFSLHVRVADAVSFDARRTKASGVAIHITSLAPPIALKGP